MSDIVDVEWLTNDQLESGYHFCNDWDFMVIHISDPEYASCACWYRGSRYEERALNMRKSKL